MKLLAFLGSGAILVAAIAQQEPSLTFPEPLASDFAKLSQAKSLKVHFSKRVIGEQPTAYTLELGRDKKFKLTDDKGFVVSDGTSIWIYKKVGNTYTQVDLTPEEVNKFRRRIELFGWEAFMQAKPGSDLASVMVGANRTVQGQDLATVDVTVKPDNHAATFLIDPKTGITQGFTVKTIDKEYLVLADKVELSSDALPDTEFAFTAPDGATLVKAADDGTFASVQEILTGNCMPCHSPDHKRGGVDLSTYDGVSAVVTAKRSKSSLLIKAVTGDGVDLMPKGRAPLTNDQVASIAKWIDAGAKND